MQPLTARGCNSTDTMAAYHAHGVAVGELEKAATPAPPPPPAPIPAADFSWGGVRSVPPAAGLTSLRDIQSQEAAITQRPGAHATCLAAACPRMCCKLQGRKTQPVLTYKPFRVRPNPCVAALVCIAECWLQQPMHLTPAGKGVVKARSCECLGQHRVPWEELVAVAVPSYTARTSS